MNKPIATFFLIICQFAANAAVMALADNPATYDFQPKQPLVISNSKGQTLTYLCEMHVNSTSDNTILIKQLQGNSVVNGTSLEKGRILYLTIRQLQTMTLIAKKGASVQFTNLGTFVMRGICYIS